MAMQVARCIDVREQAWRRNGVGIAVVMFLGRGNAQAPGAPSQQRRNVHAALPIRVFGACAGGAMDKAWTWNARDSWAPSAGATTE